ncbi:MULTISPECIES: TIGR03915 family putative DNA repair protein [Flavobacterium]|uniref:TIGR03915 family putative DNA repair protein n=1 Tax=Flavobacterium endoglycinae TaxID=2816357 RepID=A0ABX7Q9C5_9FLAO|nr:MULTISPECIES: TIGR03915 family putative DNA repair protein [Flavobacterium]QSW87620.1 TIGR03915 family putative DNA repair protein [Flavobacterium endoglycinae]
MTQVIYDGTYEGWLTAVFEIYELKFDDVVFAKSEVSNALFFSDRYIVITDLQKAKRVLKGLKDKLSREGFANIYKAFLSDIDKIDETLFQYVKYIFSSAVNIEDDLSNSAVLGVRKAAYVTGRESHRMKAFVRFKLTKDNLYYAVVEPDCDVLPLIEKHFKIRYADQRWLIYDTKRKYGIYYDLENTTSVQLEFNANSNSSQFLAEISDDNEEFFQNLWRQFFKSVNIESRKNTKLHIQHMPKRYWKNLIEKIPDMKK